MLDATQPETHGWIYDNWGNLLSAIGLGVTLLTLRAANRASRAAANAERYVLARTLSQELDRCQSLAIEMYDQLSVRSWDTAGVRCRDLIDAMERISVRWQSQLTPSTTVNLQEARDKVAKLERVLVHVDPSESPPDSQKVIRVSLEVKKIFIQEKASLERALDHHDR